MLLATGCCCPTKYICITVIDCASAPTPTFLPRAGVSVELTGPGGYSATVVTGVDGRACFEVVDTGTYTAEATLSGRPVRTKTVTVYEDTTTAVASICICVSIFSFLAGGCGGYPVEGATVTITQSGSTIETYTSDGTFFPHYVRLDSTADVTVTVSKSRFVTKTQTFILGECGYTAGSFYLEPAEGYYCDCSGGCPDPKPETLYLTDTVLGVGVTLVHDGNGWKGTVDWDWPGCNAAYFGGCPGSTGVPLTYYYCYTFPGGGSYGYAMSWPYDIPEACFHSPKAGGAYTWLVSFNTVNSLAFWPCTGVTHTSTYVCPPTFSLHQSLYATGALEAYTVYTCNDSLDRSAIPYGCAYMTDWIISE